MCRMAYVLCSSINFIFFRGNKLLFTEVLSSFSVSKMFFTSSVLTVVL